jgi:hypothetical protein
VTDGPILVHAPRDQTVLSNPDVQRRRRPYEGMCGEWSKLPPTVRVRTCIPMDPKIDMPGLEEVYLEARPHPRYHQWCEGCHNATPGGLRDE